MRPISYYDLLGIGPEATEQEIKAGWRKASKFAHPDVGGHAAQSALFNLAYEVLMDPVKRREHDAALAGDAHSSTSGTGEDADAGGASSEDPRSNSFRYEDWFPTAGGAAGPADGRRSESRSRRAADESEEVPTVTVDKQKLSWWSPDLAERPVRLTPAPGAARRRYWIAFGAWCLPVAPFLLVPLAGAHIWGAIPATVLIAGALPPRWRARLPLGRLVSFGAKAILGLAVVGALLSLTQGQGVLFAVVTALVLGGFLALRRLGVAWGREVVLDAVASGKSVMNTKVWGVPGYGLFDAIGKFGVDRVERGQLGERLTGVLLEPLLDIPGVRLVHGLPWPGSQHADVDHALVCGDQVILLDSKLWQPATYTLDRYGAVLRDGQHFKGGEIHFAHAIDAWQRTLPDARVTGWLILHPARSGNIQAPTSTGPLKFVTSADACEQIGQQLMATSGTINRNTIARLLVPPTNHSLLD